MLPTYDTKNFSLEMKKIRNESGFTLDYVSIVTGLSHTAIKSLEKGQTIPKIETLLILSNFYGRDLIELLNTCKDSYQLLDFYKILNQYMANDNKLLLQKTAKDVSDFLETIELKPVDHKKVYQLKLFFQGLQFVSICDANTPDLNDKALTLLIDALKVTNANFSLCSFEQLKYLPVEYNILFSISSLLGLRRQCEESNQILLHNLNYFSSLSTQDSYHKILTVKCLCMLSYNFHRLNQSHKALEYADKGIDFCLSNDTSQYLPLLLARKSIAKFHLGDKDWALYRSQTLSLLEIQERNDLKLKYDSVFENLNEK